MTYLSRAGWQNLVFSPPDSIMLSHSFSGAWMISIGITFDFLKIHSNPILVFLIFSSFIIIYIHLFFRVDYFIVFKECTSIFISFSPQLLLFITLFLLWTDTPRQWHSKFLIITSMALKPRQERAVIWWALLWPSVPLYRMRSSGNQGELHTCEPHHHPFLTTCQVPGSSDSDQVDLHLPPEPLLTSSQERCL